MQIPGGLLITPHQTRSKKKTSAREVFQVQVVKPDTASAAFVFVIRIVCSSAHGTHPSFDGQPSLNLSEDPSLFRLSQPQ